MRSFCPPSLHQCSVFRVFKTSQSYTERREVETRMWCHQGFNQDLAHTPTVPPLLCYSLMQTFYLQYEAITVPYPVDVRTNQIDKAEKEMVNRFSSL